jgi:hypothetical protein
MIAGLPSRVDRYSRRIIVRSRCSGLSQRSPCEVKLGLQSRLCGHYLLFRHYYTIDKVRLHAASSAQTSALPFARFGRGSRGQGVHGSVAVIKAENA